MAKNQKFYQVTTYASGYRKEVSFKAVPAYVAMARDGDEQKQRYICHIIAKQLSFGHDIDAIERLRESVVWNTLKRFGQVVQQMRKPTQVFQGSQLHLF